MGSTVNHWQAWLEHGEFLLAIYWKAKSVTIHYHRGGFDRMLIVSRCGVFLS